MFWYTCRFLKYSFYYRYYRFIYMILVTHGSPGGNMCSLLQLGLPMKLNGVGASDSGFNSSHEYYRTNVSDFLCAHLQDFYAPWRCDRDQIKHGWIKAIVSFRDIQRNFNGFWVYLLALVLLPFMFVLIFICILEYFMYFSSMVVLTKWMAVIRAIVFWVLFTVNSMLLGFDGWFCCHSLSCRAPFSSVF
jgi:hypothetical protein